MRVEGEVDEPLIAGFSWTNSREEEQWASIKYEHLSNFYYGCGKLRHTTQACREEVTISKAKPRYPMYGPWLTTLDQTTPCEYTMRRIKSSNKNVQKGNEKTWFDIMSQVREREKYGGISLETEEPRANKP